ncbi:MAG: DUF1700 domain-containing protein [Lachnospiraceae bacterium]|nr:DUF1700 domain-containing protein [Lachnospiraceae bacterium]
MRNKYEFVKSLRKTLTGKIDGMELEDTIRYYEDYIDGEIKKGKPEAQVLEELGDPRLLAKNIASVKGTGSAGGFYGEEDGQSSWEREDFGGSGGRRVPGWLIVVLILFVVIVILGVAFSVIWSLLPVIIPVFIVISIFRFFVGRR